MEAPGLALRNSDSDSDDKDDHPLMNLRVTNSGSDLTAGLKIINQCRIYALKRMIRRKDTARSYY
jgi:hypothetical protein